MDVLSAVLLFHTNMLLVGLLFAFHWRHICRHEHLCDPVPEKKIIHRWYLRSALVPSLAVIGGAVAFISPPFSLLVYLILPADAYLERFILVQ
jgi:hypothetical protein